MERPLHVGPAGSSHVNLVAGEPDAIAHGLAGDFPDRLRIGQHGVDLQQSEPVHRTGRAFEAMRVRDRPPEHLEPAAETENATASAAVRKDIDVPSFLP